MSRLKKYVLILTICLLIALVPFQVHADDTGNDMISSESEEADIDNGFDNDNLADDLTEEPGLESGSESTSECEHNDGTDSTLVKTDAVESSCNEPGTKEYWTCSVCEKVFSDHAGTEITDLEAWKAEGEEGYVAPAGHSYNSVVTREAACSTEGEITYTCENCGDTYTETIPKTAHSISGGKCTKCDGKEDIVLKSGAWYYVVGDDIQTDYTGIKPNSLGW